MTSSDDQDARVYADYYARSHRAKPATFPFIAGDALLRCIAFGDFLQSRANKSDVIVNTYRSVWQEAITMLGNPKSTQDDSDEGGGHAGVLQHQPTSVTAPGNASNADKNVDVDDHQTPSEDGNTSSPSQSLLWIDPAAIAAELEHIDETAGFNDRSDEAVRVWLNHAQKHAQKPLQLATRKMAQALDELIVTFPNLADAATIVAGATLLRAEKKLPLRFPRLLLQGEPGSGKTEFIRAIASATALPLITMNLSAMYGEFELPGGHRSWKSAVPGKLFQGLLKSPVANPIFLFDEAERGNRIVQSSLLQWLEDRYFRDQYLELNFQVDQVNSMLITNSLTTLEAAVQSRCRLFEVKSLTDDQTREIIQRIYARLICGEEFIDFAPTLDSQMIERLMSQSLREVRMTLESALYTAALHERRTLIEADLRLPDQSSKGVGFIWG
jgi:hypothetical protein